MLVVSNIWSLTFAEFLVTFICLSLLNAVKNGAKRFILIPQLGIRLLWRFQTRRVYVKRSSSVEARSLATGRYQLHPELAKNPSFP